MSNLMEVFKCCPYQSQERKFHFVSHLKRTEQQYEELGRHPALLPHNTRPFIRVVYRPERNKLGFSISTMIIWQPPKWRVEYEPKYNCFNIFLWLVAIRLQSTLGLNCSIEEQNRIMRFMQRILKSSWLYCNRIFSFLWGLFSSKQACYE